MNEGKGRYRLECALVWVAALVIVAAVSYGLPLYRELLSQHHSPFGWCITLLPAAIAVCVVVRKLKLHYLY